jgi:hypothetical protein
MSIDVSLFIFVFSVAFVDKGPTQAPATFNESTAATTSVGTKQCSSVISILDERINRKNFQHIYLTKFSQLSGSVEVDWHEEEWILQAKGGRDALDAWKQYRRTSRAARRNHRSSQSPVNTLHVTGGPNDTNFVYSYYLFE